MANAPDVCWTAPCAICGQLFDGPARLRHLRELGPCRDAIISSIKDDDLFYCDGSCENLDCKRMECCDVKWPFLSLETCERHKNHFKWHQQKVRMRDIVQMSAFDGTCICPLAENGHKRCHKSYCPLMVFAGLVRDKMKELPPCTCNKSSHQHDCKRTCPKLQFMIENKFCRKENPFRSHFRYSGET